MVLLVVVRFWVTETLEVDPKMRPVQTCGNLDRPRSKRYQTKLIDAPNGLALVRAFLGDFFTNIDIASFTTVC